MGPLQSVFDPAPTTGPVSFLDEAGWHGLAELGLDLYLM